MPNPTSVPIVPPRIPFLNPETGFVSQPWYLFLLSLFQLTGGSNASLDDVQKGPPTLTIDEVNAIVSQASANLAPSQDGLLAQVAELQKQINGLQAMPQQITQLLSQLADVNALSPVDGDKLIYIGATDRWTQDSRSYLMLE